MPDALHARWHKNAVIYSMSVAHFFDIDGDGVGDLSGAAHKLDYLLSLGVDCVWLLPITPSPMRDAGYDVSDLYGVRERLGDLGDFAALLRLAHERRLRVMIDLSLHHTSIDHPWFQAARRDPQSRYRDFYVWAEERPPKDQWPEQVVFVEDGEGPWTFDDAAGLYYRHQYYWHEPDLNLANPAVRKEIHKALAFWLQLGVDGIRVDSGSLLTRQATDAYGGNPLGFWRELRAAAAALRPDAVVMVEADVSPEQLAGYFGGSDGSALLLNFYLGNYLWLALARRSAEPLVRALARLPQPTHAGQWANFLRNHDELDLERLSDDERDEVYRRFAPDERMRIYGRGIRRRLAPMLGGDQQLIRVAYNLLLALPGAPVVLYGDELGMGDMLELPDRDPSRLAMQWTAGPNAGFCDAEVEPEVAVQREGRYAAKVVNVAKARRDPESLLNWLAAAIRTRRESSPIGWGTARTLDTGDHRVLGIRHDHAGNAVVILVNLADAEVRVTLRGCSDLRGLEDVFSDGVYPIVEVEQPLPVGPTGYRWLRGHVGDGRG